MLIEKFKMNDSVFTKRFKKLIGNSMQKEVAEKIHSNQTTVSKLLGGKLEPTVDTLINIADAYGCTVDYLLGIDHPKVTTYSDFLQMIHIIVTKGLAHITNGQFYYECIDSEGMAQEGYETKLTLYFDDDRLEKLLTSYDRIQNFTSSEDDKETGTELFDLWYGRTIEHNNDIIGEKKNEDDDSLDIPYDPDGNLPYH